MKRISTVNIAVMIATVLPILVLYSVPMMTLPVQSALGESSEPVSSFIKIDIVSAQKVHGVAGQNIRVEGSITNLGANAMAGGTAYISIVDIRDRIPVDLEDWSAQKGLYIPSIEQGQSLPLEWKLRLVKSGSYTVDMLFNKDGDPSPPIASSKIFLDVAPRLNLNPGNVLPVAFGVPALLIAILGVINYLRGRRMGIYG